MPFSTIKLYTDGGARGNPGPAAIGIVICDDKDNIIEEFSDFIGIATNNEAEYSALIKGLNLAAKYSREELICYLDSELLVRQMTGEYKVKNERLRKLYNNVRDLEGEFRAVTYKHMRRMSGHLARADKLLNVSLDRHLP